MNSNYFVSIREKDITRDFTVRGCEAAFEAYQAAKVFVEAVGIEATVDLIDACTGEVLASTYDFD